MPALAAHMLVLASLLALGVAVSVIEAMSMQPGGWVIGRSTLSTLYWLAYLGYAVCSSLVVLVVGLVHRAAKRPLTTRAVVLSHAVPVGLAWAFVGLGLHDAVQDAWKSPGEASGHVPPGGRLERSEAAARVRRTSGHGV